MRKSSSTNDILNDLERSKQAGNTTNTGTHIKQQQQQQLNTNKPSLTQQLKINNAKPTNNTKTSNSSNSTISNNAPIKKNLPVKLGNNVSNSQSSGNDKLVKNTSILNLALKDPSPSKVNNFQSTSTTPKAVNVNDLYTVVNKSSASNVNVASAVAKTSKQQGTTKHDASKVVTDSLYTNIETIQPTKNAVKSRNIGNVESSGVNAAATKIVQKPPAPTYGGTGVEQNRSSVKKGIMEDRKKASLEKKNCKFCIFTFSFVRAILFDNVL